MSQYFPFYEASNNIKVELDLSDYATKTDLKNITHVDAISFALKTNLASLKTKVDKLENIPSDLTNLSNFVGDISSILF